jgi:hypothetical protein
MPRGLLVRRQHSAVKEKGSISKSTGELQSPLRLAQKWDNFTSS